MSLLLTASSSYQRIWTFPRDNVPRNEVNHPPPISCPVYQCVETYLHPAIRLRDFCLSTETTLYLNLCNRKQCANTGLFKMISGVLTTCHTQHTSDSSICVFFFYLIEQHSKFFSHSLQVLYMCTLCDISLT